MTYNVKSQVNTTKTKKTNNIRQVLNSIQISLISNFNIIYIKMIQIYIKCKHLTLLNNEIYFNFKN